jgi:hypothetical protein
MGLEIIGIYILISVVGTFSASKVTEVYKHSQTLDADRYAACIEATKEARQCRGLE